VYARKLNLTSEGGYFLHRTGTSDNGPVKFNHERKANRAKGMIRKKAVKDPGYE
jgi:hypothetical protein